jgi:hypothetical protein
LEGEAVDEHIVRGLGDCGDNRTGRSRDLNVIRLESATIGFNGVVDGDLDYSGVQEADGAAMRGTGGYDRLHSDRIPISYGVGSYD